MAKIDLYDNVVKFPSEEDIKKMGGKIAHLIYVTPFAGSIVEYAGRVCYKSFNAITAESYKKFITTVTSHGHESVIEHTNLVYAIFKKQGKKHDVDSDHINRFLVTVMMYNGLLRVTENQGYYLISGNLRMFKDLVREFLTIKEKSNKHNPIIESIFQSFYDLPSYFFSDLIKSGQMQEKKFKQNPRFEDYKSSIEFKCLNDYVSVINHDNFSFKVRGFVTEVDGQEVVKRITTPTNILKKHNRVTFIINAPRYITHQIVRHRLASYSQASQRYIKEEGVNVYMPETFKVNNAEVFANTFFKNTMGTYDALVDMGIPKEDARAVLPNATMSTIVMTATIDEFEHFIYWRADRAAQNFIRDMIAIPIKQYLEDYYRKSEDDEETPPPYKANRIVVKKEAPVNKGRKLKKNVVKKQTQKPTKRTNEAPDKKQQKKDVKGNVSRNASNNKKPNNNKRKGRNNHHGVSVMKNSFSK